MSTTALIFRSRMLPFSETFIRSQACALKRYTPVFVGVRKVAGIDLTETSRWIQNTRGWRGGLPEIRFRAFGPNERELTELRRFGGSLLHAHFAPDACDALDLAALLSIPMICTCHGYDVALTDGAHRQTWHGRLYLRRRRTLQREAKCFLAVSGYIRRLMLRRGYPEERIRVHYIGVNTRYFHPLPVVARRLQVLFVGRLIEKKGCSHLIDAMSLVQKELPLAELVIIGDGPLRSCLELQARRKLERYTFLGKQSPDVIRQSMRTAAVFSVPSITARNGDAEGFGIVFAEAQACGLPVVAFASGGIPEAVVHGQTGLLVAETDVPALAAALLELLRSSLLRERFAHAGRAHVEQHFDIHKQTLLLEQVYDEVTTTSRKGSDTNA